MRPGNGPTSHAMPRPSGRAEPARGRIAALRTGPTIAGPSALLGLLVRNRRASSRSATHQAWKSGKSLRSRPSRNSPRNASAADISRSGRRAPRDRPPRSFFQGEDVHDRPVGLERDGVAIRGDALYLGIVDHRAELAQAPAQRAAGVVRHIVPEQIAQPFATVTTSGHHQIGQQGARFSWTGAGGNRAPSLRTSISPRTRIVSAISRVRTGVLAASQLARPHGLSRLVESIFSQIPRDFNRPGRNSHARFNGNSHGRSPILPLTAATNVHCRKCRIHRARSTAGRDLFIKKGFFSP